MIAQPENLHARASAGREDRDIAKYFVPAPTIRALYELGDVIPPRRGSVQRVSIVPKVELALSQNGILMEY